MVFPSWPLTRCSRWEAPEGWLSAPGSCAAGACLAARSRVARWPSSCSPASPAAPRLRRHGLEPVVVNGPTRLLGSCCARGVGAIGLALADRRPRHSLAKRSHRPRGSRLVGSGRWCRGGCHSIAPRAGDRDRPRRVHALDVAVLAVFSRPRQPTAAARVLFLAYIIGQLRGLIPLPGGTAGSSRIDFSFGLYCGKDPCCRRRTRLSGPAAGDPCRARGCPALGELPVGCAPRSTTSRRAFRGGGRGAGVGGSGCSR